MGHDPCTMLRKCTIMICFFDVFIEWIDMTLSMPKQWFLCHLLRWGNDKSFSIGVSARFGVCSTDRTLSHTKYLPPREDPTIDQVDFQSNDSITFRMVKFEPPSFVPHSLGHLHVTCHREASQTNPLYITISPCSILRWVQIDLPVILLLFFLTFL